MKVLTLTFLLSLPGIIGVPLLAGDWPQWRGPSRDGHLAEFTAPEKWPETLTRVWEIEVGEGWSSPVMSDGKVFVLTRQEEDEIVRCLELNTGTLVWEDRYPATGSVHPAGADHGIGPKSTPSIANGKLYTLGIGSILSCFACGTGELLWRKDFADHFPKPAPSCGTSMSPLLSDGMCIVHVGVDREGELIALDPDTGERKWTYDGDGPGYGSPVIATIDGKRQLLAPVSRFLVALQLENGGVIWRHPFPTQSSQNILTPVVYGENFIVGGIGQVTRMLNSGLETSWQNPGAPLHMSSLTLAGDRLFGLTTAKKGQLFCLNAGSGETIWTSEGEFARHAAILHGGGYVIVLTGRGKLLFLEADSDSFAPLASYTVSEQRTWTHPLIFGDGILIKDETRLTCWSF